MFGYILPLKEELKVADYESLKYYYCGLCRNIKKRLGAIPRLGLSYDSTFFSIFLDGISKDTTKKESFLCIKHPLEKKICICENEALNYATDINIALMYYKALDDNLDNKNIKTVTISKILKSYENKISNKFLDTIIGDNLNLLHSYENKKNFNSLDEICHPFSHIIGEILKNSPFELNNDNLTIRNTLYNFGYLLGKWIYLMDALDDLEKDIKETNFNPIYEIYKNNSTNYEELINNMSIPIENSILLSGSSCSELLCKLPIKKNYSLLENIIKLGLPYKYNEISKKYKKTVSSFKG